MGGNKTPLIAIVGPTATGKTEVGIELALRIGGEVISGDSMQVYRGMDIGTAKPTREEMRGVPHHMIDILEPCQEFSVALFQSMVRPLIEEIWQRGKYPILVGGTGLYVRSVIDPYDFTDAGKDESLRRRLQKEAAEKGVETLHARLQEVDPRAAAKIHPHDLRRIIRALEVYYLTGRPISSYQTLDYARESRYNLYIYGLYLDRGKLYQRIDRRVDLMIERGLVDEVRRLLSAGNKPSYTSMQAIGYKEMVAYLNGKCSLEEAIAAIKKNTRHFARRQLIWFRRDPRIQWIDVEKFPSPAAIADYIAGQVAGAPYPAPEDKEKEKTEVRER